MDLSDLLDRLQNDLGFMRNVTTWERLPPRPARYADLPQSLDPRLIELARTLGYAPLYIHQAQAIDAALKGENVILATSTASGKSLAYHLPALQFALQQPGTSVLYLFPTKALARDQAAALSGWIDVLQLKKRIPFNTYDGDTPKEKRAQIRRQGGLIITNPDMLHLSILPHHMRWAHFFRNLRLIVLDELHVYRGIFGSHVANLIRRLRRICRFHGSAPIFICASATIANPAEHAAQLVEAPFTLIDEDGSPRGEKHIILYNPPTLDEEVGTRRGYLLEARDVARQFINADLQTIVFTRSRLATEILLGYLRDAIQEDDGASSAETIRGYRGGYLPTERREIEQGLRDQTVQGVVATNALELGIDIGALSAAILSGYPGTIASTWQQFGRAGRRSDTSIGVLVASGRAIDQYIVTHPRYLFQSSPEHALINPNNPIILSEHLHCACYELPFEADERFGQHDNPAPFLAVLAEAGHLHFNGRAYVPASVDGYPAAGVNLRTGGEKPVEIWARKKEQPVKIGYVDRMTAPILVHEGAVYLHEGRQYFIQKLDWQAGLAEARRIRVNYYTEARSKTKATIQEIYEEADTGACHKSVGWVLITQQATDYRKIRRYSHAVLGKELIHLPPQQFETMAYWITLQPHITRRLEEANILLRPNDYGPNWQEQRDQARARDRYQCTRCGRPEEPDRQHDVHHITPFREYGYIPGENEAYLEANRLENLTTLCPSCHHAVETARGTQSALGGLANVLRNVAPLFLMCSANDIGVVAEHPASRSQSSTITFYDTAPGGLGLSTRLYQLHDEVIEGALDLVRDCPCSEGCPSCVGPIVEADADVKQLTIALLLAMQGKPFGHIDR
jgi:DEAD/DEAH box helicase domain-containing protein